MQEADPDKAQFYSPVDRVAGEKAQAALVRIQAAADIAGEGTAAVGTAAAVGIAAVGDIAAVGTVAADRPAAPRTAVLY